MYHGIAANHIVGLSTFADAHMIFAGNLSGRVIVTDCAVRQERNGRRQSGSLARSNPDIVTRQRAHGTTALAKAAKLPAEN
ncbi:hypothetical protein [uncultured Sphingomonas sp.]|uniref:hypothetical protein n=1 Tax=uncultured Sphingomonas sp. TaxID=158754 RepID=UPI0025F5FFF5|nr:hypothetical protein [uncultured Sphingomonas sp.]